MIRALACALAAAAALSCNTKESSATSNTSSAPSVSAPTVPAPSASVESGPAWLAPLLAPGEHYKERITTGPKMGCVTVTTTAGTAEHCPPLFPPGPTVDDVPRPPNRDCPLGFVSNGTEACARKCESSADCHEGHKCDAGACRTSN